MSLGSTRSAAVHVYTQSELEDLTKAQIAELAESLGYEGVTTNLTKAQMISAFLEQQGGDA